MIRRREGGMGLLGFRGDGIAVAIVMLLLISVSIAVVCNEVGEPEETLLVLRPRCHSVTTSALCRPRNHWRFASKLCDFRTLGGPEALRAGAFLYKLSAKLLV
jgi:hypothetical protein